MVVLRGAILGGVLVAALAAAPARAGTVVVLRPGAPVPADATPVAPRLRIWLVPDGEAHRLPGVVLAGPNRRMHRLAVTAAPPPPDPLVPQEWYLPAIGADKAQPPPPGKLVAVIDTGVDTTQPEFSATKLLLLNTQRTAPGPEEFHGTAVASIVGAPADGHGMEGVYPGAALASYDAGGETLADVLAGIATALQQPGRGVINLSVGFQGQAGSQLLQYGVDTAVAAGWLVVAAAGNGGDEGSPPVYPADLAHVLTVGAVDSNGNVPSFSSRSPYLDLAAPGVDILAAVPTWKDPSGFALLTGTSFAAPMVSAAAAWLWTGRPLLDESQVFEMLRRSATDLGLPGYDTASGFGLLDIPAALAMPSPIRDPEEPNDDVDLVSPSGLFAVGTPPLVSAKLPHTRVAARVDRYDDPVDVYRVFVPAGRELVAAVRKGRVTLTLWDAATVSVHESGAARLRDLLDTGTTVRTFGTGRKGAFDYLEVTPKLGTREATYLLSVELRAAP